VSTYGRVVDSVEGNSAADVGLGLENLALGVEKHKAELAVLEVTTGEGLGGGDDCLSAVCTVAVGEGDGLFGIAVNLDLSSKLTAACVGNLNGDFVLGGIVGDTAQTVVEFLDGVGVSTYGRVVDSVEGNSAADVGLGLENLALGVEKHKAELAVLEVTTGEGLGGGDDCLSAVCTVAVGEGDGLFGIAVNLDLSSKLTAACVGDLNGDFVLGGVVGDTAKTVVELLDGVGVSTYGRVIDSIKGYSAADVGLGLENLALGVEKHKAELAVLEVTTGEGLGGGDGRLSALGRIIVCKGDAGYCLTVLFNGVSHIQFGTAVVGYSHGNDAGISVAGDAAAGVFGFGDGVDVSSDIIIGEGDGGECDSGAAVLNGFDFVAVLGQYKGVYIGIGHLTAADVLCTAEGEGAGQRGVGVSDGCIKPTRGDLGAVGEIGAGNISCGSGGFLELVSVAPGKIINGDPAVSVGGEFGFGIELEFIAVLAEIELILSAFQLDGAGGGICFGEHKSAGLGSVADENGVIQLVAGALDYKYIGVLGIFLVALRSGGFLESEAGAVGQIVNEDLAVCVGGVSAVFDPACAHVGRGFKDEVNIRHAGAGDGIALHKFYGTEELFVPDDMSAAHCNCGHGGGGFVSVRSGKLGQSVTDIGQTEEGDTLSVIGRGPDEVFLVNLVAVIIGFVGTVVILHGVVVMSKSDGGEDFFGIDSGNDIGGDHV